MKILIVDDYQFNLDLLIFMVRDRGFTYCTAANGREAVDVFASDHDIELILMDVNMPVMDGMQAAQEIKRLSQEQDRFVPVIFVTALDDAETLAKCLENGGEDFVPKPVNESVLCAKLLAHQRTINFYKELKVNNETLQYHRRLMQREHHIVEKIFKNGLQRIEKDCRNIDFHSSPASLFNGDLLLVAASPLGGVYVLLGDFTGHGLSAAIGCMPVTDIFYAMTKKKASVSAIAREINTKLQSILPDNMFFCASIIELDKKGERMTIWSGGMNDILLVNDAGDIVKRVESQHMPMGILGVSEFEDSIQMITHISGLRVYVYTDGVIEAQNSDGEFFGEVRFADFLKTTQGPSVKAIFAQLEHFQGSSSPTDDITLVEISCAPVRYRRKRDQVQNRGNTGSIQLAQGQPTLPWDIKLKMTPENLRNSDVIGQIVKLIGSVENASTHKDIIFTLISELFNNAIEHGLLQLDSVIKDSDDGFSTYYKMRKQRLEQLHDGEITFHLKVIPGITNRIVISLTDSGQGFKIENLAAEVDESDISHARGTHLIRSLCEELVYSNGGRTATITFSLGA